MVKKVKAGKKVVESKGGAGGSSAGTGSLFKKSPRNFRLGGDIQPKRDLTRFVKWPKYVRIQRQKRVLLQRLKVPPTINQFSQTIDKNESGKLIKLLTKYSPETRKEKTQRLKELAEAQKGGKGGDKTDKPKLLKFGLNHVTTLVEEGKAKIVVIAHDVDPIELMVHLPALCRKKGTPFCFMRGKATLGKLVNLKTATCVALTDVNTEDLIEVEQLAANFTKRYVEDINIRRTWGGGIMGIKNQHMMAARQKLIDEELAKKANME
jgi:large subunit ribosomal protein L7Ae